MTDTINFSQELSNLLYAAEDEHLVPAPDVAYVPDTCCPKGSRKNSRDVDREKPRI